MKKCKRCNNTGAYSMPGNYYNCEGGGTCSPESMKFCDVCGWFNCECGHTSKKHKRILIRDRHEQQVTGAVRNAT